MDDLLEMILLQAEMLQLAGQPQPHGPGHLSSKRKLDKGRGPRGHRAACKNGTLRVGDIIVAGMAYGRVRAMVNDRGERVKSAGPSTPVEVAGLLRGARGGRRQ